MAKRKIGRQQQIDLAFYKYLWDYYRENRKKIRVSYKLLTKKFLDFNSPDNPDSFLRRPQFEALEVYIFLKEYCDNQSLHEIFSEWYGKGERFANRKEYGLEPDDQLALIPTRIDGETFRAVFEYIEQFKQDYTNYIFALTMGIGKTILMATCIFYEFLLANKYPKDERYCHNALVFAPDKTVLQSLKEIQTFDKGLVVPPEYVNWLDTHLQFHYLDESGISLNVIDKSDYNVIISNTQKIILKKQHKERPVSDKLYNDLPAWSDVLDLDTEDDLMTNQRFQKLLRLTQLGIYVDEAHHAFGNTLEKDLGTKSSLPKTSLRLTINSIASELSKAGTRVVACYNYTGTPYVKNSLLPEVVYAYGLKDAIDNEYLKKVTVAGYSNTKSSEFIKIIINDFWKKQQGKTYENMLPKLAIFASTIDELEKEVRPAVESVLAELGIDSSKILVNVGDDRITSNDDIREFINLDTQKSEKQFILLVNKGKEGWNCRSLFGVGLFRKPKSKIFVLQATMRCLRSIGIKQEKGNVYLSDENMSILEAELKENFRLTVNEFIEAGTDDKQIFEVKKLPPPRKIKLKKVVNLYKAHPRAIDENFDLGIETYDTTRYDIIKKEKDLKYIASDSLVKEKLSSYRATRSYSEYTLIAEIARYMYESPLRIKNLLSLSRHPMQRILDKVNEYNELIYDCIVPAIFSQIYDIREHQDSDIIEIELIKDPPDGKSYKVKADPDLVVDVEVPPYNDYIASSFHVDKYCFDSRPEIDFFWRLLQSGSVKEVYFTGMFTHGQTDFIIRYVDPESHRLRSYYPDFLVKHDDDTYEIIEVKADFMVDNAVIQAKAEYAEKLASFNAFRYRMVKATEVGRVKV